MGKRGSKDREKRGEPTDRKGASPEPRHQPSPPAPPKIGQTAWLVCFALAFITVAVYAPVRGNQFTEYDDPLYVTHNAHVQAGVTAAGLRWALTESSAANWHPLTWISHMVDCQLFGLDPGPHHLENVALHTLNSVLLLLLLVRLTGSLWRSAVVAALFAWHPMHVESVAWAAERKDVLSGLFWMLTLWAYAEWVKRPGSGRYLVALVLFALALLSKPMAVTLPCVLLLLDYWPLRRWKTETSSTGKPFAALVREKLPFFALAGAASAVTVWAQKTGGAVTTLARFSPAERLGNALVSYDRYLEKLFCPVDLAAYYPHPGQWPAWRITLACAVLAGISWCVWRFARRLPFAVTGWLWFLGTLVPVIGFVQVGSQSMADRYTYLPAIGIFIIVVWGVPEVLSSWPKRNALLAGIATAYLFVCLALTSAQLKVWRNDQTLFEHALRVTENNFIAHGHVAGALLAQGKAREGVAHYREAVKINPAYVQGQNNLGAELAKEGLLDEAADHFAEVIRIRPSDPDGPFNLGVVRFQQRQYEAAIAALTEAVKISPNYVLAHNALGYALGGAGRQAEAIDEFATVLRLDPTAARHAQLADALGVGGRWDEAVAQYSEALRLEPAMSEVRLNLARLLALAGRHAEAIPNFEVYVRANRTNAVARYAFAESLKKLGRLQEANLQLAEALKLDPKTRMDPKIFSAPVK